MIKVKGISLNPVTMEADVSVFADTKAEVENATIADYVGFPEGYKIGFSSTAVTTSGEVAFMKSDGSWNWL